jgi:hypothetical protein
MPFLGGVIAAIVSIISTIVSTIVSVITTIISAIWSIISTIVSAIWNFITGIFGALSKFISGIYYGISAFLTDVASAIGLLLQGEMTLAEVWTTISISWQLNVAPAFSSIWNVVNSILKPIRDILNAFKGYYNRFRNSIFGEIIKEVQSYAKILGFIFDVGRVISYLKQEKYGRALIYLMLSMDEKTNTMYADVIRRVDNQLSGFFSDLDEIFRYFRNDLLWLDSLSGKFETIFLEIGKSFGVEKIENIGEAISRFRKNVIGETLGDVRRFELKMRGVLEDVFHPISRIIQDYRWALKDWERRKNLLTFDYIKRKPEKEFSIGEIKEFLTIQLGRPFYQYALAVRTMSKT